MGHFFLIAKIYVQTDGLEDKSNFTLKIIVNLDFFAIIEGHISIYQSCTV